MDNYSIKSKSKVVMSAYMYLIIQFLYRCISIYFKDVALTMGFQYLFIVIIIFIIIYRKNSINIKISEEFITIRNTKIAFYDIEKIEIKEKILIHYYSNSKLIMTDIRIIDLARNIEIYKAIFKHLIEKANDKIYGIKFDSADEIGKYLYELHSKIKLNSNGLPVMPKGMILVFINMIISLLISLFNIYILKDEYIMLILCMVICVILLVFVVASIFQIIIRSKKFIISQIIIGVTYLLIEICVIIVSYNTYSYSTVYLVVTLLFRIMIEISIINLVFTYLTTTVI